MQACGLVVMDVGNPNHSQEMQNKRGLIMFWCSECSQVWLTFSESAYIKIWWVYPIYYQQSLFCMPCCDRSRCGKMHACSDPPTHFNVTTCTSERPTQRVHMPPLVLYIAAATAAASCANSWVHNITWYKHTPMSVTSINGREIPFLHCFIFSRYFKATDALCNIFPQWCTLYIEHVHA